jgi:hypothetical protein
LSWGFAGAASFEKLTDNPHLGFVDHDPEVSVLRAQAGRLKPRPERNVPPKREALPDRAQATGKVALGDRATFPSAELGAHSVQELLVVIGEVVSGSAFVERAHTIGKQLATEALGHFDIPRHSIEIRSLDGPTTASACIVEDLLKVLSIIPIGATRNVARTYLDNPFAVRPNGARSESVHEDDVGLARLQDDRSIVLSLSNLRLQTLPICRLLG